MSSNATGLDIACRNISTPTTKEILYILESIPTMNIPKCPTADSMKYYTSNMYEQFIQAEVRCCSFVKKLFKNPHFDLRLQCRILQGATCNHELTLSFSIPLSFCFFKSIPRLCIYAYSGSTVKIQVKIHTPNRIPRDIQYHRSTNAPAKTIANIHIAM